MTPFATVKKAMLEALRGAGIWGDQVYGDFIPASAGARPHVLVYFVNGISPKQRLMGDALLSVGVKCISEDDEATAVAGADQILALIDDQGKQDGGTILGDSTWEVQTITQDEFVHEVEQYSSEDAVDTILYHEGFTFVVRMEKLA